MTGFGRKGLGAGAVPPSAGFGGAMRGAMPTLNGMPLAGSGVSAVASPHAAPSAEGGEDMSPQLRAFLAAERANRPASAEPEISEVAQSKPPRAKTATKLNGTPRSMITAYALWYFGAGVAAHRFYVGAHESALIMLGLFWGGLVLMLLAPFAGLALLAGWLVWVLADVYMTAGLVRRYNDALKGNAFADVFS